MARASRTRFGTLNEDPGAAGRPRPIELSHDRRIRARVIRLSAVSVVALGVVCVLAAVTTQAPIVVVGGLALGWLLMPTVLVLSLFEPRWRYALVLPATSVTLGLTALVVGWPPDSELAAAGWLLVLAGVGLGGVLGLWFWYRLAPVPAVLDDPYAPARWGLIALHVALVVGGLVLVATELLRGG